LREKKRRQAAALQILPVGYEGSIGGKRKGKESRYNKDGKKQDGGLRFANPPYRLHAFSVDNGAYIVYSEFKGSVGRKRICVPFAAAEKQKRGSGKMKPI